MILEYRINSNKREVCYVVRNSLPWERGENHSKTGEVEKAEKCQTLPEGATPTT